MPTGRDLSLYALVGFSVWASGAVEFRYAGRFLFESGWLVSVISAAVISVAVCLIFRSALKWRGTPRDHAVTVAVTMALPGLFGEAARQLLFGWATGLAAQTQPVFAATMLFGNAVLFAYALALARTAHRAGSTAASG